MGKTTVENKMPLVIAGSGRSGTTWVLDVLAEANGLRPVFEPLHPALGAVPDRYHDSYLEPESECQDLASYLDRVLSGRFRSVWVDYRMLPSRLSIGRKTLKSRAEFRAWIGRYQRLWRNYWRFRDWRQQGIAVKLIRANLMLEWLVATFKLPVLVVVRHPCAVIESQIRLNRQALEVGLETGADDWNPRLKLNNYLRDAACRSRFLDPYWPVENDCDLSDVQAMMLLWCLENAWLLREPAPAGIRVVFYEQLSAGGVSAWDGLSKAMGQSAKVKPASVYRPSQQASRGFSSRASQDTAPWEATLQPNELDEIQFLLNRFNIDCYSVYEANPVASSRSCHDIELGSEVKA